MTAKNDITGDNIISKGSTALYRNNWELIFRKQQMNFIEYQTRAMTFRKPSAGLSYAVLGLSEEAGEVAGKFAKEMRDGSINVEEVVKELGDVLWMVAAISDSLGYSLQSVAEKNISKLEERANRNVISGAGDNR